MRPNGHVSIREDRSVPGGGHAEVRIAGVQATVDRANFHVRRLNYEKNNLGPEGWQGPEAEWTPLAVRQDGTDLVVSVGPDVVDRIEVGMPVEIEFPALGVTATTPWPDISPSAYSRADRSGTPARRTRTGVVAPPPPPPAAEPEPVPELVAEPATPEPAVAEDDGDAKSGPRGWAIALGALLFLLLAGGGGAYVLVTDDDLRQRMAAWLPFLEEEQPAAEEEPVTELEEPVVEEAEPAVAAAPVPAAIVPEPDPPSVADDPPEPAEAEPEAAEGDEGLPCLPEPGAWEPCVAQIMSEGRPNEEIFDLAQRYLEAEDPQMAIGLYRELMTRRRLTEAVLEIGKMYDPRYYAPHTSAFSEPNAERAIRYYRQAEAAGDETAGRMLEGLRLWLEGQAENGNAEARRLLNAQFQ